MVINNLINYGLVEKLPQSTLEIQVFKIDNTLKKNEFTKELREVFGNSYYDALSSSLKMFCNQFTNTMNLVLYLKSVLMLSVITIL